MPPEICFEIDLFSSLDLSCGWQGSALAWKAVQACVPKFLRRELREALHVVGMSPTLFAPPPPTLAVCSLFLYLYSFLFFFPLFIPFHSILHCSFSSTVIFFFLLLFTLCDKGLCEMFRYLSYTKLLIQIRMLFSSVSVLHSEPCQHVVFLFYLFTYLFIYLFVCFWVGSLVRGCGDDLSAQFFAEAAWYGLEATECLPALELWCWLPSEVSQFSSCSSSTSTCLSSYRLYLFLWDSLAL